MASVVFPGYSVSCPQPGSDRQTFTPKIAWPDPSRARLNVKFDADVLTVNFDEAGRACDVDHQMSVQARQKIRSRRQTPKGMTLPSEA